MPEKEYYKELISYLKEHNLSKGELVKFKVKLCKKYRVKNVPTDIQVLLHASKNDLKKLKLVTKPTRTISGVAVVAVMSHPFKCPHGACTMCPSKTSEGVPQSYTGKEPATMRGIRNNFDSYIQVFNRLEQYAVLGQKFDKVEFIIMGGTFPSYKKEYKEKFVMYAFKAMNDFSDLFFKNGEFDVIKFRKFFLLPGKVNDKKRTDAIHKKILKCKKSQSAISEHDQEQKFLTLKKDSTLKIEQKKNQTSNIRCVGLTIETRPDYGLLKHGNEMLGFGATRVELGVQSVYDEALKRINRGHSIKTSIDSIRILKDLGFKLNFHYMPGLPGINEKKDLDGMKKLFLNKNFRPDMLKIYPCMVIPDTKLYDEYKQGKFTPLTTDKAIELIRKFKNYVPPYVRIMRVQRDIPTFMTEAGVNRTNLRQMIDEKGHKCRCIRCREAGHVFVKKGIKPKKVELKVLEYDASKGKEFFISAEDFKQGILLGFCRLRFPSQILRKEITKDSALVRELHVYGEAVSLGGTGDTQHKGWGKKLLKYAEDIAKKHGKKKIIVISGVGVREYYRKLGYELEGSYMVKNI